MGEKLAVHLPFSVYLGWITIASIANVSASLVWINWDGFGISPEIWAAVVVSLALIITLLMLGLRKDFAYGLVIIWAFIGIGVKQTGNQTIVTLTQMSAVIVGVALMVVILVAQLRKKQPAHLA